MIRDKACRILFAVLFFVVISTEVNLLQVNKRAFAIDEEIALTHAELQQAVDNSDGTLVLEDDYVLNATVSITKNITISAKENKSVTLMLADGFSGRHFLISGATVQIEGLTLKGNNSEWGQYIDMTAGGGIRTENASKLTLKKCVLSGNAAQRGGGIFLHGGTEHRIERCAFNSNMSESEGGAIYYFGGADTGRIIAVGNIFYNNSAGGNGGGAIYAERVASVSFISNTVDKCTVYNPTDSYAKKGAAVNIHGGTARIYGNIFAADKYKFEDEDYPQHCESQVSNAVSYIYTSGGEYEESAPPPDSALNIYSLRDDDEAGIFTNFADEVGLPVKTVYDMLLPQKEGMLHNKISHTAYSGWNLTSAEKECHELDYFARKRFVGAGMDIGAIEYFKIVVQFYNGEDLYTSYFQDIGSVALPDTPKKDGYIFVGWAVKMTGPAAEDNYEYIFDFDTAAVDNDLTLYARWEREPLPSYIFGLIAVAGAVITVGIVFLTILLLRRKRAAAFAAAADSGIVSAGNGHIPQSNGHIPQSNGHISLLPDAEDTRLLNELTLREREVFDALLTGKSLKEISADMNIAYGTVHNHYKKIYSKLHISSRSDLFNRYKHR